MMDGFPVFPTFKRTLIDKRKLQIGRVQVRVGADEAHVRQFLESHVTEACDPRLLVLTCFSHTCTLLYVVLLGGTLYHATASVILAVIFPPIFIVCIIYARLRCSLWWEPEETNLRPAISPAGGMGGNLGLFARFNRRGNGLWLCEYEDRLAGTVAVERRGTDTAVIKYVCVHGDFRRMGVGEKLFAAALKFCRENRYRRISSSATDLQLALKRLLRKYGFTMSREEILVTLLPFVHLKRAHFMLMLRR